MSVTVQARGNMYGFGNSARPICVPTTACNPVLGVDALSESRPALPHLRPDPALSRPSIVGLAVSTLQ